MFQKPEDDYVYKKVDPTQARVEEEEEEDEEQEEAAANEEDKTAEATEGAEAAG